MGRKEVKDRGHEKRRQKIGVVRKEDGDRGIVGKEEVIGKIVTEKVKDKE